MIFHSYVNLPEGMSHMSNMLYPFISQVATVVPLYFSRGPTHRAAKDWGPTASPQGAELAFWRLSLLGNHLPSGYD
jgi:hypothetical protein